MPKQSLKDERYDFRGGRNTAVSPDLLNANELADSVNARLVSRTTGLVGGFEIRNGSRRLHATALSSPLLNGVQWDGPNGKQLLAIGNNGHLFWRDPASGDFGALTDVTPATLFANTIPQSFAQFRGNTSGAPLYLYIGDNTVLYRWTGAALTKFVIGTQGIDNAALLAAYHTRLFGRQLTFLKNIIWSKVGDGETWTASALPTDPGSAMVGPLTGDAIVAIEVVGSSLLMAAANSIARFTGYSTDDIRIASDTEGLSMEVGAVGPLALRKFEGAAALLSDRGPYVVTEGGVTPFGAKLLPDFQALSNLSLSSVAYHKGRKEIWFAVSRTATDGGTVKSIYIYSVDIQAWSGPFTYPFSIVAMFPYKRISDGSDTVAAACTDGFIRDMDIGVLDDVLSDGTGGSSYQMSVEVATHLFSNGPYTISSVDSLLLDAMLQNQLVIQTNIDEAGWTTQKTLATMSTSALRNYRADLSGNGCRIRLRFQSSDVPTRIYGYAVTAFDMKRPCVSN